MTEPVKTGRPSKYENRFCELAESVLGEGYSEAVLAGDCGVCIDTITEWKKVHPDFSASIKRGRAKGARVWEDRLRVLATANEGNATAVIFGLKNRQPEAWKDKTEQELSGTLKVNRVELIPVEPVRGDDDSGD